MNLKKPYVSSFDEHKYDKVWDWELRRTGYVDEVMYCSCNTLHGGGYDIRVEWCVTCDGMCVWVCACVSRNCAVNDLELVEKIPEKLLGCQNFTKRYAILVLSDNFSDWCSNKQVSQHTHIFRIKKINISYFMKKFKYFIYKIVFSKLSNQTTYPPFIPSFQLDSVLELNKESWWCRERERGGVLTDCLRSLPGWAVFDVFGG